MLWACSGPEAWRVIAQANEFAHTRAGIATAILAVSTVIWMFARHRLRAYPALCVLAVAVHPAWSVSALRGDCGLWKMEAASGVTYGAAGILFVQALHTAWLRLRANHLA